MPNQTLRIMTYNVRAAALPTLPNRPRLERLLTREAILEDEEWVETLRMLGFSFDPGSAALEETLHEKLMPSRNSWLGRALGWIQELWRRRSRRTARRKTGDS